MHILLQLIMAGNDRMTMKAAKLVCIDDICHLDGIEFGATMFLSVVQAARWFSL
jgi:hypothetical protein